MADSADILHFISLTEQINKVKSPNSLLKNRIFGDHRSMPTENFEVGVKLGEREIAPFIRKGGQAVMVSGYNTKSMMVSPANISLKRPFSPEVMFLRRPGFENIYASQAEIQAIGNQALADDVQRMGDMIANAEEYLCAQALTGVVAYQAADAENFEVDFQRDGSLDVSPVDTWDDQTNSDVFVDLAGVKRLINDFEGLPVTEAFMGRDAAAALVANTKVRDALALSQTKFNVGAGLSLVEQYQADGALFLGELAGIRLWEYGRKVVLPTGSSVDLIDSKTVHFVANVPAAEFRLMYGAIAEIVGQQPRMFVGERFSKSWTEEDPPQVFQAAKSRPMPVLRKPNATASMVVLT